MPFEADVFVDRFPVAREDGSERALPHVLISAARLKQALAEDGKLHAAPELVVEVLSPGNTNERRDREAKLKLYSRHGVQEYWIVDWMKRQVEVYQREQLGNQAKIEYPIIPV